MVERVIYPAEELPPHLKCQVLSFIRMVWPDGFVGPNRLRSWITGTDQHPVHIMLVEKGLLISQVEVVWKYLEHCGETYKAYGLTGVLTYPSFRGQGHGRAVVDAGTEYLQNSVGKFNSFTE